MLATTHLGFGALGATGVRVGAGFGGMPLSPMPPQTPNPALPVPPKTTSQQSQDDLLGLF